MSAMSTAAMGVWANSRHYSCGVKLYVHKPAVALAAQINMPGQSGYPVVTLQFYNVTSGAYTQVKPGMTILIGSAPGLSDYGRQRVRSISSQFIGIGRSSRGRFPGEINIVNNAYITVLKLHEVWSKTPYIQPPGGTQYKDGDIPIGTNNTQPPPVANCGIGVLADIPSGSTTVAVNFTDQGSFAAPGRTITSWAWDFGDGTPATSAVQNPGDVTFPQGARYIYLTVTDDVGKTHTANALIATDAGTLAGALRKFQITSYSRAAEGQEFAFSLHEDLSPTDYVDGTVVMAVQKERYWSRKTSTLTSGSPTVTVSSTAALMAGMTVVGPGVPSGTTILSITNSTTLVLSANASASGNNMLTYAYKGTLAPGPTGREQMMFWGWIHQESIDNEASENGLSRSVNIQCKDVAGRLAMLPGFPQVLERNSTGGSWFQYPNLTMDDYLKYLAYWHSNAAEVTDFTLSGTGSGFPIITLGSDGASLYEQIDGRAQAICYRYVCDRFGRLRIRKDNQLHAPADRGITVQNDLDAGGWYRYSYSRLFWPRTHWGDEAALLTGTTDANAVTTIGTVFAIAPGEAPGQGLGKSTNGQQLVVSQAKLNERAGRRYDRANSQESHFEFQTHPGECGFDPAYTDEWMRATIPASTTDRRMRTYTNERLQVRQVSFAFDPEHGSRSQSVTGERETGGFDAVTVIPPSSDLNEATNLSGYPIDVSAPSDGAYKMAKGIADIILISSNGQRYLTHQFSYPSSVGGPTDWAGVTMGVSGTPVAFVVDAFSPKYINGSGTVDGWVATTTGLYKVTDLGGTPSAVLQLTFRGTSSRRSIQSSFGGRHLIVTSAYADGVYRSYSTDGSTWSTEALSGSASVISGDIAYPGAYASPRTAGLAYLSAYISTAAADGYKSTDYGATISALGTPDIDPGARLAGDIHVPYAAGNENTAFYGRLAVVGGPTPFELPAGAYEGAANSWHYNLDATTLGNGVYTIVTGTFDSGTGYVSPVGGNILIRFRIPGHFFQMATASIGYLRVIDAGAITYDVLFYGPSGLIAHNSDFSFTGPSAVFGGFDRSVTYGTTLDHIDFSFYPFSGTPSYLVHLQGNGGNNVLASRSPSLIQAVGTNRNNVSPSLGFGPWKGRQIDSSPVNQSYMVAACGDTSATNAGVWLSANGGSSWSGLVAPTNAAARYEHAAISGDGKNVVYVIGTNGMVGVCEDFSTVDSRMGNMASAPPTGTFIGICGG